MLIRFFLILMSFSLSAMAQQALEGTIYFGIEDDLEGHESRKFVDFHDAKTGKVSELTFKNGKVPPGIAKLRSGDFVKIKGRKKQEGEVQYDGSSEPSTLQTAEDLRSVPKVNGAGSRTAIVVRVNLADEGQESCNSESDLQNRIFSQTNSASGYSVYKDNSYGGFSFTGKVVTVNLSKRTTDYTCSNSDLQRLSMDANAALAAQGIDPYSYNYQQYYIPSSIPCGFGGRAYLGANLGWVRTCSNKTPIHEFGHNFGMGHADSTNEANYAGYGDYSDYMGIHYRELNAPHRDQLGWIPSSKIVEVNSDTKANFKLASLSAATSSTTYTQAIKFPHTDTGSQIYFSYRTAVGSWDNSLSTEYRDLMSVHERKSNYYEPTVHLQSLAVGEVYADAKTGITVEVLSKTPDYMEVAVNGGSGPATPTDSEAPSLAITNPKGGESYYTGASISASATASDNVGVKQVNFYLNGSIKCTDTSAPYSCALTAPSSTGSATISVKAMDASGNITSKSASVSIIAPPNTDTTPPSVTISSPASGSSYEVGSTVAVTVSASDNVGVTSVQVWHESYWHTATKTSSGYTYSFKMTEGSTQIRAMAKDSSGNQGFSDFTYLTVKSATPTDTTAPSVSLTSPGAGAEIAAGQALSMTASASDNVGVTRVDFYVGGSVKCSDSSAPYGCSTAMPATSGTSVYARAYDAAGNSKISSSVMVKNPEVSTVDTQAPTAPRSLSYRVKGKNNLELSWGSASDNVGVVGYRVYKDGNYIGQTTELIYQEKASGSHSYSVKAIDAAGNVSASSNSVTVTVGGGSDGGGSGGGGKGGKGGGKPTSDGGTCKGKKC